MDTPLIWDQAPGNEAEATALADACDIDPVIARLLVLRGITAPDEATRFLSPALDQLHDPFSLTDLPVAVDRLLGAIARGERIAVHGDYDVDGVTSTVMLRRLLELLGDLFETQSSDVPQVQHTLVGLSKASDGLWIPDQNVPGYRGWG